MSRESDGERTLRAKYLDWCSAQVADHFLRLSPEEIYELADSSRPAGADSGDEARAGGVGSVDFTDPSYRSLVQRVTETLLSRLELPEFDDWKRAYREDPEPYDRELAGFWRHGEPYPAGGSGGGPGGVETEG